MSKAPGAIRDPIIQHLSALHTSAGVKEIEAAVRRQQGDVSSSSIRSYLNINTPGIFERVGRGQYKLAGAAAAPVQSTIPPSFEVGKAIMWNADCFSWLRAAKENSVEAVLTDPPYGLVEYTQIEKDKLRAGKGGVWRVPPTIGGHTRSPLPRFTTLTETDRQNMRVFFRELATLLTRVVVPGGNIVVAANPLLVHIVASAMSEGGLEMRGMITRLVMTMRGGDRPKNAHVEFSDVSVMPRSQHEPWVVLRKPLEGRAQDNLRKWKTGGFRRISEDQPFGDVIKSRPTSIAEKQLAPHPSLKPQALLRDLARACLPLGVGRVLDPFAGSGSTLAACNAVGYQSIGVEMDAEYFALAERSIPALMKVKI